MRVTEKKAHSLSHCVGEVQNDIQEIIEDVARLQSGPNANYPKSGTERGKGTSNASGNCGTSSEIPSVAETQRIEAETPVTDVVNALQLSLKEAEKIDILHLPETHQFRTWKLL